MIAVPGIVIAYMATKMPQFVKPVGLIFIFAIGLGITVFFGFGILGPTGYLLPEAVEEAVEEVLNRGYRNYDIMSQGKTQVGTREMGDLIAGAVGGR